MKNLLLPLICTLLFNTNLFSQWVINKIDNNFDDVYVIAYTEDGQQQYLKLENYNGIVLYLTNTYICSETVIVNLSFFVNGEYKRHKTHAKVSSNHKTVFIEDDISEDTLMLQDFKDASLLKVRINDPICDTEIYEFKMQGSTEAYEAVLKQ
jgi:hypothetical protein